MKLSTVFSGLFIGILAAGFSISAIAQDTASGEVAGKCGNPPQQPNIPNGMQANMDDMLAAQKKIKTYQESSQTYRACIDELMSMWDSQVKDGDKDAKKAANDKKDIAIAFYNKSVSDEEEVANLFNAAVRAYKGKK